jgi:hypothetical protein
MGIYIRYTNSYFAQRLIVKRDWEFFVMFLLPQIQLSALFFPALNEQPHDLRTHKNALPVLAGKGV